MTQPRCRGGLPLQSRCVQHLRSVCHSGQWRPSPGLAGAAGLHPGVAGPRTRARPRCSDRARRGQRTGPQDEPVDRPTGSCPAHRSPALRAPRGQLALPTAGLPHQFLTDPLEAHCKTRPGPAGALRWRLVRPLGLRPSRAVRGRLRPCRAVGAVRTLPPLCAASGAGARGLEANRRPRWPRSWACTHPSPVAAHGLSVALRMVLALAPLDDARRTGSADRVQVVKTPARADVQPRAVAPGKPAP